MPGVRSPLLQQLLAAAASVEVHVLMTQMMSLIHADAAAANDYIKLFACPERFEEVFR